LELSLAQDDPMSDDYPKSKWGSGPWQEELDEAHFECEGIPCLVLRSLAGTLCGYVAVPKGHPWHGQTICEISAEVHGGVSWAAACDDYRIYIPPRNFLLETADETDVWWDVWWVGFDTSHFGDYMPAHEAFFKEHLGRESYLSKMSGGKGSYKNMEYVKEQTRLLAHQAAALYSQMLQ
jgi:hypothetical protein